MCMHQTLGQGMLAGTTEQHREADCTTAFTETVQKGELLPSLRPCASDDLPHL